jgi:hypothetical protein
MVEFLTDFGFQPGIAVTGDGGRGGKGVMVLLTFASGKAASAKWQRVGTESAGRDVVDIPG